MILFRAENFWNTERKKVKVLCTHYNNPTFVLKILVLETKLRYVVWSVKIYDQGDSTNIYMV